MIHPKQTAKDRHMYGWEIPHPLEMIDLMLSIGHVIGTNEQIKLAQEERPMSGQTAPDDE